MIQFIWRFTADKTIGTEIMSVVARGWGLGVGIDSKGHNETFGRDGNFLNLNCGSSYMTI